MSKTFVRLTRQRLRAFLPGQSLSEHGIYFKRMPNGDGVYKVNVMVDGQRIHRLIGRESDGTTRTQAEEYIEKARQDARTGRLNLPKNRKIALGFREAIRQYLDRLTDTGGKDLIAKRRRLTLHLGPFFEDKPLSTLTTFDIERYKKARREQGAKPGTINRELAVLSHMLTKALEWQWIEKRPVTLKRLPEDRGRIVYLTVEQAQRLVTAAMHDANPNLYPFVVIGLATSMRKSEIFSIRREHIDLPRRLIYIPKAKAGAREQPITAQLATFLAGYLDALPEGSPWLFPSLVSRTGHVVDIRDAWRRSIQAAGLALGEVVPHTLRHTAITHLVQARVDLPTVKRISGHKTLAMVERYSHQNGAHIEAAMDALEARYTFPALPTAQRR